jgi:hypothetical protein
MFCPGLNRLSEPGAHERTLELGAVFFLCPCRHDRNKRQNPNRANMNCILCQISILTAAEKEKFMGKGMDSKKADKKSPAKSMKEKKADKKIKKAEKK